MAVDLLGLQVQCDASSSSGRRLNAAVTADWTSMNGQPVCAGLDFGVILIRNSERSKQLFSELVDKAPHFQVSTALLEVALCRMQAFLDLHASASRSGCVQCPVSYAGQAALIVL